MLPAEPTVLVHFKPIRIVFLVFHCVVVALLTFCASQCDFNSHNGTSRFTEIFFAFTHVTVKTAVKVNASLFTYVLHRYESIGFRKAHHISNSTPKNLFAKKRTFQR